MIVTKRWFKALPVGRRAWWNNPKAPSTDQPTSKWMGNPIGHFRRTTPSRMPIWRGKDVRREVPGFFEGLATSLPPFRGSEVQRLQVRNVREHQVRRALVRAAPRIWLNYRKPGGLDRIRGPKFNPRLPGLVPEALKRLDPPAWRGSRAPGLPGGLTLSLAEAGRRADILPHRKALPVGRGFQVVGWA